MNMQQQKTIFVISDLHMGDGGPRDNFAVDNKEDELGLFLDYVESQNGSLVILGDLFEFWQANIGKVLMERIHVLDRFAAMGAVYVVGNHDADLEELIGADMLSHPFFDNMTRAFTREIAGRKFKFMHGHEVEPIDQNGSPGWGKILAILGGIIEDKKGSPLLSAGGKTEKILLKTGRWFMWLWNCFVNRFEKKCTSASHPHDFDHELTPSQSPGRAKGMVKLYHLDMITNKYDIAIVGHTHAAKSIDGWYYNSGCWVGLRKNFIRILPDSTVEIHDWTEELHNGEAAD